MHNQRGSLLARCTQGGIPGVYYCIACLAFKLGLRRCLHISTNRRRHSARHPLRETPATRTRLAQAAEPTHAVGYCAQEPSRFSHRSRIVRTATCKPDRPTIVYDTITVCASEGKPELRRPILILNLGCTVPGLGSACCRYHRGVVLRGDPTNPYRQVHGDECFQYTQEMIAHEV